MEHAVRQARHRPAPGGTAAGDDEALQIAERIGYPVLFGEDSRSFTRPALPSHVAPGWRTVC